MPSRALPDPSPGTRPRPRLAVVLGAVLLLAACDASPPPREDAKPVSNVYREALDEAAAVKDLADQRAAEEQRIDALLGRTPPPAQR